MEICLGDKTPADRTGVPKVLSEPSVRHLHACEYTQAQDVCIETKKKTVSWIPLNLRERPGAPELRSTWFGNWLRREDPRRPHRRAESFIRTKCEALARLRIHAGTRRVHRNQKKLVSWTPLNPRRFLQRGCLMSTSRSRSPGQEPPGQ